MSLLAMKLNTLHDLFVEDLKDIYDAELQVVDALPKMIDKASSPQLRSDLENHLGETRIQVERLEEVFDMLDMEPDRARCKGMAGIIADGQKILSADGNPDVIDAGIIEANQKVEHYEIASYGTMRSFANTMGHRDIAANLQRTLREESKTDELLSSLAERSVNPSAPQM